MRRKDIRDLTRAKLFVPFRLFLTNGERFDVRHPKNDHCHTRCRAYTR